MANLFDYLIWRGDLPFSRVSLGEIDGMILSRLSYLPLAGYLGSGISLGELWERVREDDAFRGALLQESDEKLLEAAAHTARFRAVELYACADVLDSGSQTQFCAVTAKINDYLRFVAFRGTDNTLVGWKEDFNMSFSFPVPSQEQALRYFESVAAACPDGYFILGGHSKGGNLATYAASFCPESLQRRIARVYSYDGPGFPDSVLQQPGYRRMCDRISTFVPQSSVVGMMLVHEEKYTVIRSSHIGLMQHDVYSWEVLGKDFVTLEHVTGSSKFIDRTLKLLVAEMTTEQREAFGDTIYAVVSATNAQTIRDLGDNLVQNMRIIGTGVKNLDEPTRRLFAECVRIFFSSAKRTAILALREEWEELLPQGKL